MQPFLQWCCPISMKVGNEAESWLPCFSVDPPKPWAQRVLSVCVCVWDREREREKLTKSLQNIPHSYWHQTGWLIVPCIPDVYSCPRTLTHVLLPAWKALPYLVNNPKTNQPIPPRPSWISNLLCEAFVAGSGDPTQGCFPPHPVF